MSMNITFDRAWLGHPINLAAGKTAGIALPAGWVLRASTNATDWTEVASPYTATEDCWVRVDCDTHAGTPVTATLTIS